MASRVTRTDQTLMPWSMRPTMLVTAEAEVRAGMTWASAEGDAKEALAAAMVKSWSVAIRTSAREVWRAGKFVIGGGRFRRPQQRCRWPRVLASRARSKERKLATKRGEMERGKDGGREEEVERRSRRALVLGVAVPCEVCRDVVRRIPLAAYARTEQRMVATRCLQRAGRTPSNLRLRWAYKSLPWSQHHQIIVVLVR